MKRLRRCIVLAFATLNLLITPMASAGGDEEAFSRYAESKYTYCDAKLLAHHWQGDVFEAKVTIGNKIGWGNTDILESNLVSARQSARDDNMRCDFWETGFSYDDVEVLSSSWGMSISDAKILISDKVFMGRAFIFQDELAELRGVAGGEHDTMAEPLELFWASDFTFCDARLLAQHWDQGVFETKTLIGQKLQYEAGDLVHGYLETARKKTTDQGPLADFACRYNEEGYSFDDVQLLAKHWKLDTSETKVAMEQKILWGGNPILQSTLAELRKPAKQPLKKAPTKTPVKKAPAKTLKKAPTPKKPTTLKK